MFPDRLCWGFACLSVFQAALDLAVAKDLGFVPSLPFPGQVIRLISIACVSPEAAAPATAPLRKRFVEALLERGLLKVMADIAGDYENQYLRQVNSRRQQLARKENTELGKAGLDSPCCCPRQVAYGCEQWDIMLAPARLLREVQG